MNQLLLDTLTKQYERSRFKKFTLEFFNQIDLSERAVPLTNQYSNHIDSFLFLGEFIDQFSKKIHVLDVKLKSGNKLEQARTMQRNLIAQYLKDHWIDGALVAFYSDDFPAWRLSLVKVEYKFDDNGKTKEELSPAKRYSFLVGQGEPTHTAQNQLNKIFEQTSTNPTLDLIEEAFSVERVTKEFFEKYRELFESVVAELKSNHTFQNEAIKNNIDTESFAKKLLGQIVFLYFLQKKGWLGVSKVKSWGEGDKMFLRNIYNKAIENKKNFFNNYLETLFYDTLNNPRNDKVDRNYSDYFESKIPFLNGGLFEPQYDWKNSLMYLNDKLFGKIFDVFDLYNFTVKEDEPLEKEVAVDPEMLGKVFENLLEENLRKGKGTYYTPREIVHYMCQESLINYLLSQVPETDTENIKHLVLWGVSNPNEEGIHVSRSVILNSENSIKLDDALRKIKIVDPACGSGAFLVGMLQEIIKARLYLSYFNQEHVTEYQLKKDAIQNSIYGVDIDPGAIEIAKLRLWLSLVVDYDLEEIEPLPNLDYKIMVGNSLIELYSPTLIAQSTDHKKNEIIDQLKDLKDDYYFEVNSFKKAEKRLEINSLIHLLINYGNQKEKEKIWDQILGYKAQAKLFEDEGPIQQSFNETENKLTQKLENLNKLKDISDTDHFEWHLNFNEVFDKGGFDVVIANPPYIKEYTQKSAFDGLRNSPYYQGKMDLWYLFACKGIDLSKERSGLIVFIAQNNWVTSYGASKMRNKVIKDAQILSLIDFGDFKVFDAGIQTMVMIFKRNPSEESYSFDYRRLQGNDLVLDDILDLLSKSSNHNAEYLNPQISRTSFMDKKFTFSNLGVESVLEKLVSKANFHLDPITEVANGIHHHHDQINRERNEALGNQYEIGDGIFVLSNEEKDHIPFTKEELEFIKPSYTTKEIFRWYGNPINQEWVIYTDSSFKDRKKIEDYPNIKRHLDQFKKVITSDNKPYGLHRARNEYFFKGEKIIAVRKCARPTFTYIDFDSYVSATFYVIKTERINQKYLVGLLNSSLIAFWLRHRGKMQGNNYQIDKEPIIDLPILEPSQSEQKEIINTVDQIIKMIKTDNKNPKVYELEKQIDQMVYKLYGLTPEEIAVVEGGKKNVS